MPSQLDQEDAQEIIAFGEIYRAYKEKEEKELNEAKRKAEAQAHRR